ncbi:MAG: tyrosine-type recombinase/integrase, partial [Chloroflexi bacterium]|nr:tyrosine-type recombinase/integrase [Chloroflexota bacterium]
NDFISFIKHEENLSYNTVSAYAADVGDFLRHLEQQGISITEEISHLHIRSYLSTLYGKLDKRSIARKTSSIRTFLKYLNGQGYINVNVLSRVIYPKTPEKLMFALSVDEMNSFLSSIDATTTIGKRNLAIIEMLYGAGLRVSELALIKLGDIDFDQRIMKILGKGRKERLAPFNQEAANTLKTYLDVRGQFVNADKPNDYIFLNKSGGNLGVRSIQRLTKFISIKAGLLRNATPHTMRHSYATHLLEAGASIKTVKELLGHASIAATQRYTHLTMDKLSEMYKKAHPKA